MKKIKQAKKIKKVRGFLPFPMSVMAAGIMKSHYRRKNRTKQEKQEDRAAWLGGSVVALFLYGMFLYWIIIGY